MGNFISSKGILRRKRNGRGLRWTLPAVAFFMGLAATVAAKDTLDFFNESLFFEKVNQLSRISLGMSEAEVIRTAGPPMQKMSLGDGTTVFLYRLRLYKGPGPFDYPRQIYLTSETRVVFDKQGRVVATFREP